MQTGTWLTPVPAELKETLAKASIALHQATAVDDLRALLPRVREAYAAMSYEDCKRVFCASGEKVVEEAKLERTARLCQEILPLAPLALSERDDRRESERKFKIACDLLAAGIDSDAPPEHLTRLYRQAIGFEMDIPAELSSAYRTALDATRREERSERKKQFALAAALVGAIVLALIALAWVMFTGVRRIKWPHIPGGRGTASAQTAFTPGQALRRPGSCRGAVQIRGGAELAPA